MEKRDASLITTIRQMPFGMFWSREEGLTPEQAQHQCTQLREMPVLGTSYLLAEDEPFLLSVPYRHRN